MRFIIFFLFIVGCSIKKPLKKEDNYIVKALLYENQGDYNKSISLYKLLYKKTQKPIYFAKYIQNLYFAKKYDKVIKLTNKNSPKEALKYKVLSLIIKGKIKEAKKILLTQFKKDKFFYTIMIYILIKENNLKLATQYLKSLYALNPSKKNLLQVVDLLIKIKRYNEALAYLRTHLNLYGCDYDICIRLANIYKSLYDYENLANIYEKLGKFDSKFYILALNIYIQNKNYKKAILFIKKYNLNPEYLMYVYELAKDYDRASKIAFKLYKKTQNTKYLKIYCEYLYKTKKIKKLVKSLKLLAKKEKSGYAYNFLGYILINYDINYKKGIKYIKKALKLNPHNKEYLDSLAWGYYKLKKCKKAYKIIKNIKLQDKEIQKHKNLIKRCLNDFRKNYKKNKRRVRKKKKK